MTELNQTKKLLVMVSDNPTLEADWVELLSQMEYVGARKIFRSVPFEKVSLEIIQHAYEESSHAFQLKKLAVDLKGKESHWKESSFCKVGWDYFSEVDKKLSQTFTEERWYQATSLAVELRVMQLYPSYLSLTNDLRVKEVLKNILKDEKDHYLRFSERYFTSTEKVQIDELEQKSWNNLLSQILK